jgi:triacylglycerol lipase
MADTFSNGMDPILTLLDERPSEEWEWSFEPDATDRSAVNALALGNAALLAYSDWDDIQHFLGKWQLSDARLLSAGETQGFVARRDDAIFISFRGTEPLRLVQWADDINYRPTSVLPNVPGLVHGGFAGLFQAVRKPMQAAVEALSGGGATRLFVTGHSLGGALAVIAAAVLQFDTGRNVSAVYTYGQPRVGNPQFSSAFDAVLGSLTFRYVNDLDIVPHVPPVRLPAEPMFNAPALAGAFLQTIANVTREVQESIGTLIEGDRFAHVGQLMLFLRDGSLTSSELAWQEREVIYSGTLAAWLRNAPALLESEFADALRQQDRLLDHDPLRGYLPKLEAQLG